MEINPLVSVLMPVYNAEHYLNESIESVLNQDFKDFEFILINDGSSDKSEEIIKSYRDKRIKYIYHENRGIAASLNIGINITLGKYIARMDADDISYPERLKTQYEFLELNNNCVVVGSNADIIDKDGIYLYTSKQPTSWQEIKELLPGTPFFHSSTMIRVGPLKDINGYIEGSKHYYEDIVLWNRIVKYGEFWNITKPLIKYRLVSSAFSNLSFLNEKKEKFSISLQIAQKGFIDENDKKKIDSFTSPKSKRILNSEYYLCIGKIFIEKNFNRFQAIKNLFLSLLYYPINRTSWFNLFLCFLPYSLICEWKQNRNKQYTKIYI